MSALETKRDRYREWLAAQQVKFSFDAELAGLALRTKGAVQNDVPPVELWHQILPTVRVLERVRGRFGPTTILSAYRSPAYNAAVGGAEESWHMQNFAIDFHCALGSPAEWAQFLFTLRDLGEFKGGVGTYLTRGFVHVDTRGRDATWTG